MIGFVVAAAMFSVAQDAETKETFLQDHTRNPAVLSCLASPSTNCAIRAALTTAVEEQLAAEKSRVLVGVARALYQSGSVEQANVAAEQARVTARSVGLSFTMQFRLRELVPLEAELGNGATAIALADEIISNSLRDNIIARSAMKLAQAGHAEDALIWLDKITNKARIPSLKLQLATMIWEGEPALALQTAMSVMVGVESGGTYGERLNLHALIAALGYRLGDTEAWQAGKARLLEIADYANDNRTFSLAWTWRAWLGIVDGDGDIDQMLAEAMISGYRLRSTSDREHFASIFAPIARTDDQIRSLVRNADVFEDPAARIDYLYAVAAAGVGRSEVANGVLEVLAGLEKVDSAYDRDEIRMRALTIAIRMGNTDLGLQIVRNMEDDDSQARGLAEIAVMLG